jgi:hypothetical protein
MLALDTETDRRQHRRTDRIVSAAAIHVSRDGAKPKTWLADPGTDIPEGATAVHGITTDHARAARPPAKDVVEDVLYYLGDAVNRGLPIVGHNVVYDLSIIDREARRHLGCGLDGRDALRDRPASSTPASSTSTSCPRRRRVSEKQGAAAAHHRRAGLLPRLGRSCGARLGVRRPDGRPGRLADRAAHRDGPRAAAAVRAGASTSSSTSSAAWTSTPCTTSRLCWRPSRPPGCRSSSGRRTRLRS